MVLVAGYASLLVAGLIATYAGVVGQAGVVARYGTVGMVVNLGLTVPLVLLGSLGVVAATAVGEVASVVYLLYRARRSITADLPNPLRYVPLLRAASAGGITFVLELALRPHIPSGPVGLLATGLPALAGLGVFAVLAAARPDGAFSRPAAR